MTLRTAAMRTWIVRLTSSSVIASGLTAITVPLLERVPDRLERLLEAPVQFGYASRSLELLIGVTLLYLGLQLGQRKVVAWWMAVIAMGILISLSVITGKSLSLIFFSITLGGLLLVKEEFKARSEAVKIQRGVAIFAASIALALAYGTMGFYLLDKRDFGVDFSLEQSLVRSLQEYSLVGNADLQPHSRHAEWFLDSLGFLGSASILFGVYCLFRPLAYEYSALPAERRRMEALLEAYPTSTEDFFKLWPHDKSYYFTNGGEVGQAYGVAANIAVVLGDPVGPPESIENAIREFDEFCLTNGWPASYVYISDRNRDSYRNAGFELLKIGEDAVVSLNNFSDVTANNKHFRNIRNRFEKEGFTFEITSPPHSPELLRSITRISNAWLKQPDRKEWQFLSGSFSVKYMATGPLMLARRGDGKVQAFANQIPTFLPDAATIDLMRYYPEAPKGIMDYLFMMSMLRLREDGYKSLNLGLAPLSGLATGKSAPEEKLLNLLYRSRQTYLSFQGLRQFKDKFDPVWEPRYIAYEGGIRNLPRVAYALNKLMRKS